MEGFMGGDSGSGYERFLGLLAARSSSVSALALQLNGKSADGKIVGRTSLAEVLLGKRAGESVWRRLKPVLTEEEYDLVKAYAEGRLAGSAPVVSPIVAMKERISAVRAILSESSDDATAGMRIRKLFEANV
jgi:hypothetical protein